jgi:hypothetical protein
MGSTEVNIGLHGKSSSRVLKPPGGGHSDIFGEPDVKAPAPRPEYNQQNSSNLNCVMNTTDANLMVKDLSKSCPKTEEVTKQQPAKSQHTSNLDNDGSNASNQDANRANRVPPGGFSSGLW